MSEFSDEEVRKFMEQYYPKYKDNLVLGRLLYARHLGRVVPSVGPNFIEIKLRDVGAKYEGQNVKVRGMVATAERYEFLSCPKCMKKNCSCGFPEDQKIKRVRISGIIGDEEVCVGYVLFLESGGDLEVGKEYTFYGSVKKRYDNDGNVVYAGGEPVYELMVRRFEAVDEFLDENAEKVIEFVRKAKKVKVDIVRNMCKKLGVKYEALGLKEVDGYVVAE